MWRCHGRPSCAIQCGVNEMHFWVQEFCFSFPQMMDGLSPSLYSHVCISSTSLELNWALIRCSLEWCIVGEVKVRLACFSKFSWPWMILWRNICKFCAFPCPKEVAEVNTTACYKQGLNRSERLQPDPTRSPARKKTLVRLTPNLLRVLKHFDRVPLMKDVRKPFRIFDLLSLPLSAFWPVL